MEKRIRIGVLGCASIAERSAIPAILKSAEFKLVAVASRSKEKAERLGSIFGCAAIHGYEKLIDRSDVDALYIPLPPALHEEWVLRSIEKKRHVLVEKPLTIDLDSAVRIVNAATRTGVCVAVNYMFVHHSQHAVVLKLLSDGLIGELRLFRGTFGFPPRSPDDFRYSKELGGGALLDAGVYPVRAAQMILGNGMSVAGASLSYNSSDVDVWGSAQLSSPIAPAQIAFGFDNFYQCSYELWGSRGRIVVSRAFTAPVDFSPNLILELSNETRTYSLSPDDHFQRSLAAFAKAIVTEDQASPYKEMLDHSRLVSEIRRAASVNEN